MNRPGAIPAPAVALAAVAVLGATCVIGMVERASWRAARDAAPPGPPASGTRTAVVALGYPSRADGRPHPVQRWRVAMALRTARAHHADVLVCSGGAVRNAIVEADTMAELARRFGYVGEIRVERRSRSTRENVALVAPLVQDCARVLLVSDPHHVRRARRLWLEARPDDGARVFGGDTHRLLERWWSKLVSAGFERYLGWRHHSASACAPVASGGAPIGATSTRGTACTT